LSQLILDMASSRVSLVGLATSSELKGMFGEIVEFAADSGRHRVRLLNGSCKRVKSSNLLALGPLEARSNGDVHIIVLGASHMRSVARLASLETCLTTVLAQEAQPSLILWSISCDPSISSAVQERIHAWRDSGIEVMLQESKHSQLEHFAKLFAHGGIQEFACSPIPCFWVFSDDDDLWHPTRIGQYKSALSTELEADAFVSNYRAQLRPGGRGASTADEVEQRLHTGEAVHVAINDPKISPGLFQASSQAQDLALGNDAMVAILKDQLLEFWHIAVRVEWLSRFLAQGTPYLLAHPHGDRGLLHFLLANCRLHTFDPSCWMYYYNRPLCRPEFMTALERATHTSGGSVTPSRSAHEYASTASRSSAVIPMPADILAFVASLRENIELMLLDRYYAQSDLTGDLLTVEAQGVEFCWRSEHKCLVDVDFVVRILRDGCRKLGIRIMER